MKNKIILEKNNVLLKGTGTGTYLYFFKTIRTKCHLNKFLVSWVSHFWIFILTLTNFASVLSYSIPTGTVFKCLDPDPFLEYGSGSTKLLNTVPIRIRIYNTLNMTKHLFSDGSREDLVRRRCGSLSHWYEDFEAHQWDGECVAHWYFPPREIIFFPGWLWYRYRIICKYWSIWYR